MLSPKIRKKRSASTTLQWRSDKALVKAAHLTLQNEVLAEMLAVVENASPLHSGQLPMGVAVHDHSMVLGIIKGYDLALQTLESLGTLLQKPKEPEQTYAPRE